MWETLGRLELARGNTRAAVERLLGAADVQQHVSDFIGLARTTAALADIALESGNPARAIELLESSIELNREKGSPLGLAFNRRALGSLVRG
ncbi:MAG: tetratricopeptide repeat protein [Polyangiaceae bacterium]